MSLAADGMGLALGGLRRLAQLPALDRYGLRERVEELVQSSARNGFVAANSAARTFARASKAVKGEAARQAPRTGGGDLFDLTPDDEQQMLVDTFADFAENYLRPAAREADDTSSAPAKLTGMAAEMGALVLGIPESLGGVVEERSSVTAVLAMEALAHGDMGLAAAFMAPAAVPTALSLWGTAEQQARYLTPFTGDEPPVAALAVAEPRPLFDPFDLQTTARRSGDGWVLDGLKAMVAHVETAELFCVAATVEGQGPALFLVPANAEGLGVKVEPTMGVRALAAGELSLTGVTVDDDAILAADHYSEVIARSRIAWAALATGTCQAVMDYVIPYVKDRHAFGEPIAHRQGVAFMVSNIGIETEGLRLATYRAAALADRGRAFTREAAVARQIAVERAMQIGSDGVQLLGGHGYVKEHPVERWYRDLRATGQVDGVVLV